MFDTLNGCGDLRALTCFILSTWKPDPKLAQLPINWITIMSSGRSNVIRCGEWGTIEFVHTSKLPNDLTEQLEYDARCHLWRASVALAVKDMKSTRRNLDLIDWSVVHESV